MAPVAQCARVIGAKPGRPDFCLPKGDGDVRTRRLVLGVLLIAAAFALSACKSAKSAEVKPAPPVEASSTTESTGTAPVTTVPAAPTTAVPAVSAKTVAPKTSAADGLHSPKPGKPERKQILDALRVPVERKLGQPVEFEVDRIMVQDGRAFVLGRPLKRSGGNIDYLKTPYRTQVEAGAFDDGISALLQFKDGAWRVVTFNIGATDVAWEPWAQKYNAPPAIFSDR